MAKTYTHRAVVTVPTYGGFPIDMLRYDACYPVSEQDSAWIESTITDGLRAFALNITVERHCTARQWSEAFTVARWESFCVQIRPVG